MVEDLSTTDLIRWSNDGTSFIGREKIHHSSNSHLN